MAKHNVYIGRVWPLYPTHVRITVGTSNEMAQFQVAFDNVMKNKAQVGALTNRDLEILANHDGRQFLG
jgi:histidinol-phosphate aminotransferase